MIEAISLPDDLDSAWTLIVVDAEAKERRKDKLVEVGNIIQVNLVLSRQAKLIVELCKHIMDEVIRFHFFVLIGLC